jgi:hypothetical protein
VRDEAGNVLKRRVRDSDGWAMVALAEAVSAAKAGVPEPGSQAKSLTAGFRATAEGADGMFVLVHAV